MKTLPNFHLSALKLATLTGEEIRHIAAMSIKMFPGEAVRAYLDVYVIPELIEAEAILSLQSLMEAADFYGFKLVRKEEVH